MQVPSVVKDNPVLIGIGLAVLIAGVWFATRGAKGMGQDIGGGVVNGAVGLVSGAAGAVKANALDPNTNPLYDFGTWLGGKVFDVTHPQPDPIKVAIANAKAAVRK